MALLPQCQIDFHFFLPKNSDDNPAFMCHKLGNIFRWWHFQRGIRLLGHTCTYSRRRAGRHGGFCSLCDHTGTWCCLLRYSRMVASHAHQVAVENERRRRHYRHESHSRGGRVGALRTGTQRAVQPPTGRLHQRKAIKRESGQPEGSFSLLDSISIIPVRRRPVAYASIVF